MSALQFARAPKMKPLPPKRSVLVAALDVGTSKIACMIGRLRPRAAQDASSRRTHTVDVVGFGVLRPGTREPAPGRLFLGVLFIVAEAAVVARIAEPPFPLPLEFSRRVCRAQSAFSDFCLPVLGSG